MKILQVCLYKLNYNFRQFWIKYFLNTVGFLEILYSDVSLLTLQAFPTSEEVLEAGEETIANKIKELCKSRSQQWANSQAEKLMAAAAQNPFQKTLYHSLIFKHGYVY